MKITLSLALIAATYLLGANAVSLDEGKKHRKGEMKNKCKLAQIDEDAQTVGCCDGDGCDGDQYDWHGCSGDGCSGDGCSGDGSSGDGRSYDGCSGDGCCDGCSGDGCDGDGCDGDGCNGGDGCVQHWKITEVTREWTTPMDCCDSGDGSFDE